MMASPEWYYEENLKGKTAEQIMTQIRSLKRKIYRLREVIDHPDYFKRKTVIEPNEITQLSMLEEYLEKAKETLVATGGNYIPTKAERRAAALADSIPYVSKIVFIRKNFYDDYYEKVFTIGKDVIHMRKVIGSIEPKVTEMDISESKEEFLEELADVHLERWRRHYDLRRYGIVEMDGVYWELKLYFSNGHRMAKFTGDNMYHFDFYYLEDALGLPFIQND